jgi:large subunit ribosomal protein L31
VATPDPSERDPLENERDPLEEAAVAVIVKDPPPKRGKILHDHGEWPRTRPVWVAWCTGPGSRSRYFPVACDPATAMTRRSELKPDIHPQYVETTVTCTCGNTFVTRSTAKNGVIHADVCSQCHPFYTGKQKILDTGGRVARFQKRFGKKVDSK